MLEAALWKSASDATSGVSGLLADAAEARGARWAAPRKEHISANSRLRSVHVPMDGEV